MMHLLVYTNQQQRRHGDNCPTLDFVHTAKLFENLFLVRNAKLEAEAPYFGKI